MFILAEFVFRYLLADIPEEESDEYSVILCMPIDRENERDVLAGQAQLVDSCTRTSRCVDSNVIKKIKL